MKEKKFEVRMPHLQGNGKPVILQLFSEDGILSASAICTESDSDYGTAYDLPVELLEHILVGLVKFGNLDRIP